MAKLRKVMDIGKSKIIKELDVIKMIKTIRTLKEFVKGIDGNGLKWKEVKQKVQYLEKYVISIDDPIDKINR